MNSRNLKLKFENLILIPRVLSQAITKYFRKLSQSDFASYHKMLSQAIRVLSQAITKYFRKLSQSTFASYQRVLSQGITKCFRKLS